MKILFDQSGITILRGDAQNDPKIRKTLQAMPFVKSNYEYMTWEQADRWADIFAELLVMKRRAEKGEIDLTED